MKLVKKALFPILSGLLLLVIFGCKGGKDVVENVKAIKSDDPDIRRDAIMSIGEKRDLRAIKVVAAVLEGDPDRLVRSAAAEALGKMKSSWATPHLLKALKDREYIVRWDAVKALGEIGDESALPELRWSLRNDPNEHVRSAVVTAITKIAENSPSAIGHAVEALIEALRDRNESIALTASIRLSELTGQSFGMNRGDWIKWWNANKDNITSK